MFKVKTIVLGVCGVFSMAGCASLIGQGGERAWRIEPSYGIEHGRATPEGMYRLGRYYQGRVSYDQAIAAYRAALEQDRNFADAHNGLGVIYASQGRYDEAIREFQMAIAIASHLAHLHNNLGYAYLLQGSNEKAVKALQEAWRLDPGNEKTLHNLVLAHQRLSGVEKEQSVGRPIPIPTTASQSGAKPSTVEKIKSRPESSVRLVAVAPNVYELREPELGAKPVQAGEVQESRATRQQTGPQLKPFKLEVSNGNGVTGMARRVAGRLERIGIATGRLTNQLPFDQASTEVQYREGYRPEAARLASALQGAVSVVRNDRLRNDIHVRLVLGQDIRNETALFVPQTAKSQLAARAGG